MHELPQNLLGPIQDFEKAFTVDRSKLKEIVNHFVKELEKGELRVIRSSPIPPHRLTNIGLSVEGGNIVRTPPFPGAQYGLTIRNSP